MMAFFLPPPIRRNELSNMIRDLSETIRAILEDPKLETEFKELAGSTVVFDRPTEHFTPQQSSINVFLYDVRENMELRSSEPYISGANGAATIQQPPLRVLCSYLITAWPVLGADLPLQEHRLLSQALQVLSRYPTIPKDYLKGKMVGQEPPLPMITARTDGLKDAAEFWHAIGNNLRASLTLTATISMDVFEAEPAHMAQQLELRIGERTSPDETKIMPATTLDAFRIIGQVTGAGDAPVSGALVSIIEIGLAAITDDNGLYTLGMIPAGSYTLRGESGQTANSVNINVPAPAGKNFNLKLTG